jgi:hypothetical protein
LKINGKILKLSKRKSEKNGNRKKKKEKNKWQNTNKNKKTTSNRSVLEKWKIPGERKRRKQFKRSIENFRSYFNRWKRNTLKSMRQ